MQVIEDCSTAIKLDASHIKAYFRAAKAYAALEKWKDWYVRICLHMSAYVSIRQLASAYVSIRQHTSAYVSMRPRG
jgi:hypothetical protein